MKKRSGPALAKQKRPLKNCPACNGRGLVKPMFYELPCDQCHASGVVDKETGQGIPVDVLVLQLRIRLNERDQELADVRARLARITGGENGRGYGSAGARYHGD